MIRWLEPPLHLELLFITVLSGALQLCRLEDWDLSQASLPRHPLILYWSSTKIPQKGKRINSIQNEENSFSDCWICCHDVRFSDQLIQHHLLDHDCLLDCLELSAQAELHYYYCQWCPLPELVRAVVAWLLSSFASRREGDSCQPCCRGCDSWGQRLWVWRLIRRSCLLCFLRRGTAFAFSIALLSLMLIRWVWKSHRWEVVESKVGWPNFDWNNGCIAHAVPTPTRDG